jgi:histidyl-tRNA synthetase
MKFKSVRGTRDVFSPEIELWQELETKAQKLLKSYGFSEIRTPIFEESALFNRSIGEDTDIVEKEMYSFQDKKGRDLTLRPEGTAGVIRAAIEQNLLVQGSVSKLYYLGPMFRYERPQAGRYRQFYQIGAESIGSASYRRDLEIILWCCDFFSEIGLDGLKVYLNSVGCDQCRPAYREVLKNYLKTQADNLCADCQRRAEKNPLRVLDCKVDSCRKIIAGIPAMQDWLCEACKESLGQIEAGLKKEKIEYTLDKYLVRGLDYYTRTVFEIKSESLGSQDTVAAGGRYDKLVKELGGPEMPAVGFALGLERVSAVRQQQKGAGTGERKTDIFFALLGEQAADRTFDIIRELRKNGLKVEAVFENKSLKSQMRLADQSGAAFTVILGEEELKKDMAMVRNMATKEQQEVKISGLSKFFKERE